MSDKIDYAAELGARRKSGGFVPFAVITKDGSQHIVREPTSFAIRETDIVIVTASKGTVKIQFDEIARIEDRRPMTDEQTKMREDLVAHLDRSPFAPFSIQMTDGTKFEIVRRFQAAVGNTKGTVVSADESISRNFHIRDILGIKDLIKA
jgi:hypothetical protein